MGLEASVKRLVRAMVGNRATASIGPPVLHAAQFVLGVTHREVVSFAQPARVATVERIRSIVTSFPSQTVGVDEAYLIHNAVHATSRIGGALAEVGVFRGGTARVICEAMGARELHLFDTFAGLPTPGSIDTAFKAGEYSSSLESVQAYLVDFPEIHFHAGLFPDSAEPVRGLRFSFVHLDVDLYQSTLDGLAFFYPRMNRGAMLISHDYVEFPAVRQAFDDYFSRSDQPVLELTGNQCLVVKAFDADAG